MFEKLLLAIDDSRGCEIAVLFAGAYAQQSSASVHVLHVNERLIGGRGLTLLTREEATALVTDAVRQLRAAGVTATGSVQVASHRAVPGCIASVAHERGCDAIVLGSHRRRSVARLFSGRVRARTLRRTSLPILTAPSPLSVESGRRLSLDEMLASAPEQMPAVPAQ